MRVSALVCVCRPIMPRPIAGGSRSIRSGFHRRELPKNHLLLVLLPIRDVEHEANKGFHVTLFVTPNVNDVAEPDVPS